jgi:autotransporter-associated beta strand protein
VLDGSATNTFAGAATVNAGILQLGKSTADAAIAASLTIGDGVGTDTVRLAASNQIGNTAAINFASSGVLDMQTFSDTVGNLNFNDGGQVTGSGGGSTVTLLGTLTHTASANTATIQGATFQISGSKTFTIADGAAGTDLDITSPITQDAAGRSITKDGAGTLRLAGSNSFSGGLTLNAGTLILAHNNAAGTGTLTLAGGTVSTTTSQNIANAVNVTGDVTIGPTGAPGVLTFSGVMSGSGNIAIDNGGTLRPSGASANLNTGAITVIDGNFGPSKTVGVNATGGNLVLGDSSTATKLAYYVPLASEQLPNGSTVTVRRSGQFNLSEVGVSETIASLALEDGQVLTGTGTLTVTGSVSANTVQPSGGTSTFSGNLNLGGGSVSCTVSQLSTLDVSANVSNGTLSFGGANPGTLVLSGNNAGMTFSHNATNGTVVIGSNTAFGTAGVVVNGGPLVLHNFSVLSGPRTLANDFSLLGDAVFNLAADLTLNGNITGNGGKLYKTGTAKLTLAGAANAYTLATNVSMGTWPSPPTTRWRHDQRHTVNVGAVLEFPGVNYTAAEP